MKRTIKLDFGEGYTALKNPHALRAEGLPPMDVLKFMDGGYQLAISMIGYKREDMILRISRHAIHLDAKPSFRGNCATRLFKNIFQENLELDFEFDDVLHATKVNFEDSLLNVYFKLKNNDFESKLHKDETTLGSANHLA